MFRHAVATAATLTLLLGGCSDEADEPTAPTDDPTSAADCTDLVPPAALDAVGWSASGGPLVEDGTCRQETDGGAVTVQRRPVPATSEDEVPASATEQFDKRCAVLGSIVDDVPGEEVDWLGPERRACAALPDDGAAGTSSMVALVSESVLMEFRLESDAPLAAGDVQAAMTELADAAAWR